MSTLEDRELLIQQRQAEKYINVIRLILLSVLTAALLVRSSAAGTPLFNNASLPLVVLLGAWLYVLAVQVSVSRGFFPRYLPWFTACADLVLIGAGFSLELSLSSRSFTAITVGLNWGYALLFLVILFSTLRERAVLTLLTGAGATALYALLLIAYFRKEPFVGFWTEQTFRMGFLLLAGLFSSFHARTVRKAFVRATTSDRLRRETDSRLKVLALHFPGVLFQAEVQGPAFHLRYVSEGCRELLGFDSRELLARPGLFFGRVRPVLLNAIARQLAQQGPHHRTWDLDFRYRSPSRNTAWLNLDVTVHQTVHGSLILNGLVRDVTEQRRAAELLREANQSKTDFLATMSHELRTPLNAILGNADHLGHLAVTDDDRRAIRDLQGSGEALLGLIEDILVFSRLEAGRLKAEVRPFAWRSQLESLAATFQGPAQAKGLSVELDFPLHAPAVLISDSLRLRQIVGNLLSNAVKFTPSGSIRLSVKIGETNSEGWLAVRVDDTGIGIPEGHLDRIFEKFTQGEHGKSRTYGGLGLGLSIARSLAELLGGRLSCESRVGKGSSFQLRIPVGIEANVGVEGALGTEPGPNRPKARVLVVEDNVTNQDVATRMLRKLGAEVELAPGGREAVDAAAQNYFDVIFMDWQMPVMDGREATARIRALPGGQDLVIVALSGHALPGDRELLLASGFDDYLSKPVRMEDFRATLAKWVRTPRAPS